MKNRFKNVLITGASSGIGKGLAQYYAENGAENIFICGRNKERLEETRKECANYCKNVFASTLDVTDKDAVSTWIRESNKKASLDLVVANAGVGTLDCSPKATYATFETNIFGVVNTILPTIDLYKADNTTTRSIAIVSSIAGYHGLSTCPDYSATKACVKAWGEALRVKLKPDNINVNIIMPGFVKSNITDQNTCPMPGLKSIDEAAEIIAKGIIKNKPIISFPWYLRFSTWIISILPNWISDYIYSKMPNKA